MIILGLCERLEKVATLWSDLRFLDNVDIAFVISNNQNLNKFKFLGSILKTFFYLKQEQRLWIIQLLLRGKIYIYLSSLMDEYVQLSITKKQPDIGLHATGIIYRQPIIDCFKLGILNPHIGILPQYRGRSVMEWTVLFNDATGITTFFIDDGIDTGQRIVLKEIVPINAFKTIDSAKNYLFSLDGKMFCKAIKRLQDKKFVPINQNINQGKRYYVMSELFREVVSKALQEID